MVIHCITVVTKVQCAVFCSAAVCSTSVQYLVLLHVSPDIEEVCRLASVKLEEKDVQIGTRGHPG